MKTLLFVISSSGTSIEAIDAAFEEATKTPSRLICVYIIDKEVPDAVSSWMIYIGFMGDELSEEYHSVVLEEYKIRARETLTEIRDKAKSKQVSIETDLIEGQFVETVLEQAEKYEADLILLDQLRHVDLKAFLKKGPADEITKKAKCEVLVIGK
ncbi:universal stress protein [bacterium]|nr:universal stress protein [bacterium]